ncbi:TetR/AcrR family transcriptional regulator C-terminal domain-containing protein [Streptomyces sp. NPDC002018]|uniref:TetR/AcrR family transcriptional regulator C-terminal domain-containing protein n=1 Tax=Streptomyces sp. NPDC002018 TaxID=3364629 RepID=UPI0036951C55
MARRSAARRHPHVLPLLIAQVPVGPNGLAQRERVLRLLLAHGFPADLAARTFTAVSHYVIGFAAQQHGPGSADPDSAPALAAFYRGLDPTTYPAITAAARTLTRTPLDEEFHFGLALLVKGLEPVVDRHAGTPRAGAGTPGGRTDAPETGSTHG